MKKLLTIFAVSFLIQSLSAQTDKLHPMQVDGKYGYGYQEGVLIIGAKYDDALYFEDGLAPVKKGDKWGYINEQGVTVIPFKFDYANIFDNSNAIVASMGADGKYKYGLINKSGTIIIPYKYESMSNMEEGMAAVSINNMYGFINSKGMLVIPAKYQSARDFVGGLVAVQLNNKWGFIDKKGMEVVPAKYDVVVDFKNGMAVVSIDKKYGYVNTQGKEVVSCQYDNATNFEMSNLTDSLTATVYSGFDSWLINITGAKTKQLTKAAPKIVITYDSITYTGKLSATGLLTVGYSNGQIKSMTLNDEPVTNIYRSPISVGTKKMGLRGGSKATLKIVYQKNTKVWFIAGQGVN